MSQSELRTFLNGFLHALSRTLFIVATISFFIGGRIIHQPATYRIFSEVLGIGFALVCGFADLPSVGKLRRIGEASATELP